MASRKRTATTKFPVKQRKELGDNLASVDCENVASEAIDRVLGSLHCNHFNDRRQFLSEQKSTARVCKNHGEKLWKLLHDLFAS